MTRTDAVEALYQDMSARHRARFRSIHVCRHHVGVGSQLYDRY
jgi:ribosomal protein L20A (L18A)